MSNFTLLPEEDALLSLELKISKFLRYGVLISGILMLTGWTIELFFQKAGDPFARFQTYQEIPLSIQLSEVFHRTQVGLFFSYAGLFILISLPIIRVALTAVLFLKQKERVLAAVAIFVLICLVVSFTQGLDL